MLVNPLIANPHGARIEQRFQVHVEARLHWNRHVYDAYTFDVSRRGLQLLTHCDPEVRYLVKLEIDLPDGGEPLVLHAMVVHLAHETGDLHNRAGLRLYGNGEDERQRWGRFIDALASPAAPTRPVSRRMRTLTIIDPMANPRPPR